MDNNTYIHILTDTLNKKNILLEKLLEITSLQESYISNHIPDMDLFEQTLSEKEDYINQINQLDVGFEKIYDHVKEELSGKRIEYREYIENLQELIKQITDKSAKMQASELRNKSKMEAYLVNKKKEIKNFKINSKTASNYYKNMNNQQALGSYFLDKKK